MKRAKPGRGRLANLRPFPKGVSGNPGGRPKADPQVTAALEAGNLAMLELLWKHAHSKNEAISLRAVEAWLAKSLPDAKVLELSGPGGGPIPISEVRNRLAEKLAKLLGVADEAPRELELNPAPASKVLAEGT